MFKEFKTFIARGNVLDMAVGVIIGGAFSAIVTSLVNNVFMPVLGLLTKNADFSKLAVTLREAVTEIGAEGEEVVVSEAVVLNYGAFIQSIIDFILIALCVFLFVKAVNTLKAKAEALSKKEEEEKKEEAPKDPEPTKEEVLLTEIRDLLKSKN